MGTAVDLIIDELKALGYSPFVREGLPDAPVVIFFEYSVPVGKYLGEVVLLGVAVAELDYPRCPPHWVHLSPPYDDNLGGATHHYLCKDDNGLERKFIALSRPPEDFWDRLSPECKNMTYYLDMHISRFCEYLK